MAKGKAAAGAALTKFAVRGVRRNRDAKNDWRAARKRSPPKLGGLTPFRRYGRPHYGPGNRVDTQPYNEKDALYWRHDKGYTKYATKYGKKKTYFQYNKADEDLLRELDAQRGRYGYLEGPEALAYGIFDTKRRYTPRLEESWAPDPVAPPRRRRRAPYWLLEKQRRRGRRGRRYNRGR